MSDPTYQMGGPPSDAEREAWAEAEQRGYRAGVAQWLVEHIGDGWDRRLILTPDKSLVVGDILLDDAPKHEWYGAAHPPRPIE